MRRIYIMEAFVSNKWTLLGTSTVKRRAIMLVKRKHKIYSWSTRVRLNDEIIYSSPKRIMTPDMVSKAALHMLCEVCERRLKNDCKY
ncbi:MAG: hypothetical protein BWY21_01330 [Parcubacteria group bacterium ADurb.Bin216]|nr:MAG: hypothetical protein BWY21_01330 [Parcubacteria group bacterium ADurb.Bin216]